MKLLEPIQVGKMTLKNRIMFPPLTTGYEERDGSIGQKSLSFYERLAKGGASYVVIGDVAPVRTASPTPKLYSEEQIPAFKKLADTLHQYDCKVALQIFHPEYDVPGVGKMIMEAGIARQNAAKAKAEGNEEEALKQTELAQKLTKDAYAKLHHDMQHFVNEATVEQLNQIKESIASCAHKAMLAGIDAIEVHGDRLLGSLCSEVLNHRSDVYGGSFENRYRFAVEVVKAIKKECGDDYPVMLRYSVTSKVIDFKVGAVPGEEFNEIGRDMQESEKAAKYLQDAGYDALNADNGTYDSWYWAHPPVYMPLNCNLKEVEHIKKYVDIPVICAGRMQADVAAESIASGNIDAVAIGRQFICDGEYLTKLKEGREEDIRPCISCHNACLPVAYYKNSGVIMDLKDIETQGHCALNPVAFEENKYQIKKVANPKKVVIIGGGIGGMETARLCAMMGHKVDLYEKTDRLGGVFIAAAAPEFKEKDKDLIKWYCTQIAKLPISVHLNTEVKDISKLDADEIVIATGSKVRKLPIIGFEKGVEAVDFLLGNKEVGETVAVIGGGLTGCEIAYDLARKGKKPFIVEMADELIKSAGICAANSSCLKDYLRFYKVPVYLESSLKEIKDNGVIIQTADGIKEINCESVILSVGYTPNPLCEKSEHIHVIGDAAKVGNLKTVIWGAYDLAFSL